MSWAHSIRHDSVALNPEGDAAATKKKGTRATDLFLAGGRSLTRARRCLSELSTRPEEEQPPHPLVRLRATRTDDDVLWRGSFAGGGATHPPRNIVRVVDDQTSHMQVGAGGGAGGGRSIRSRTPTPAVRAGQVMVSPGGLRDGKGAFTHGQVSKDIVSFEHSPSARDKEGGEFLGFTKRNKFGRSWGEFHPDHEAVVQGVDPKASRLGASASMRMRNKDSFAKLIDRRSGLLGWRDRTGTLHSTLSIMAADPYSKHEGTTSPFAKGNFEDASAERGTCSKPPSKQKEELTKKVIGKPGGMTTIIPLRDVMVGAMVRDAGGVTHNASAGVINKAILEPDVSVSQKLFEEIRGEGAYPSCVLQTYKEGSNIRYRAIRRADLPGGVFKQSVPDWVHHWPHPVYLMEDVSKYMMHKKQFGGHVPVQVLQHTYNPVSLTSYS